MKTYSQDLRERVVRACDRGCYTQAEIADLFDISTAWIRTLLRRRRESGSVARKTYTPGRKRIAERDATLLGDLERLLNEETAGDPISDAKWVRSSIKKLCDQLRELGHEVGQTTVY